MLNKLIASSMVFACFGFDTLAHDPKHKNCPRKLSSRTVFFAPFQQSQSMLFQISMLRSESPMICSVMTIHSHPS